MLLTHILAGGESHNRREQPSGVNFPELLLPKFSHQTVKCELLEV